MRVRKLKKTKTNKGKQSNKKLEDTKAGIRSQKFKTERQYNDKKKNVQRTDNNLQNTTQITKDQATRTLLKSVENTGAPEG